MGYTKNIAVIKGIKDGFSADGGALSGLVKAEKYGLNLKVEVSLINFAPLTEGKYVCAVSDGKNVLILEDGGFEGNSAVDTSDGFAALICCVKGQVMPVASAICGNFHDAVLGIKAEIERAENPEPEKKENKKESKDYGKADGCSAYEDEAIAEVNYYEYEETYKDCGALCKDKEEEKDGYAACGDEKAACAVEEEQNGVKNNKTKAYSGGNDANGRFSPLVEGGVFYENMKDEIDKILSKYPPVEELESLIEESKWVKISYGGDNFYVFGVLYKDGKPKYICYGVPAEQSQTPPESMKDLAGFIPSSTEETQKGYWVMYQDAETGASIKVASV